MKLSLPTRVPLSYLASFNVALLLLELAEGTPVWLALTAQAFLFVAGVGFNVCGGMVYPSGAYIFFNAVLSAGLGIVLKAILAEPLQSNLIAPQKTMLVYLAGMCCTVTAGYACTKLRRKNGLLAGFDFGNEISAAGLGCLLISTVVPLLLPKDLEGTFGQFNVQFLNVGILLVVYQTTKASNGRRSLHPVAFVSWAFSTVYYGMLQFSKQGMFTPSVAWAAAAIAAGYRASLPRLAMVGAVAVVGLTLLTPYSQLARNYAGRDDAMERATELLLHPLQTRETYNEQTRLAYELGNTYHWFNEPQGLMDRLTMVPIDDALIDSTDTRRPGSPYALWTYVLNIVPKFLYPDKPLLRWGNLYAHDIGILANEDDSTGISFTPYADGYHTAQWLGVTLYLGMFVFVMFLVCDSVGGNADRSPWAVMYILFFAHSGSEGMLAFTTYSISNLTVSIVAAALITKYVAPLVGGFVLPPRRPMQQPVQQTYNRLST